MHTIEIDDADTEPAARTTTLAEDLRVLRELKEEAERHGREKKKADDAFRIKQRECLDRMEVEECGGYRDDRTGYLFTYTEKDKFNVNDRDAFVEWALANEPDLVAYKEIAANLNQLGRRALDDGTPLPPGVSHYPDPYISQRKG